MGCIRLGCKRVIALIISAVLLLGCVTDGLSAYASGDVSGNNMESETPTDAQDVVGETDGKSGADGTAESGDTGSDDADEGVAAEADGSDDDGIGDDDSDAASDVSGNDSVILSDAFSGCVQLGGVKITVTAPAGVFPDGCVLHAAEVKTTDEIDDSIDAKRDEGVNLSTQVTYDIKVLDKNGKEVEPDLTYGEPVVRFEMTSQSLPVLYDDVQVYHIKDGGVLNAAPNDAVQADNVSGETSSGSKSVQALDVTTSGDTTSTDGSADKLIIEAATDGFSYYTVEFYYGDLEYVMDGDSSIKLSTIQKTLGLEGYVSSAVFSNPELVSFTQDEDGSDWTVTALQAFSTEEKLTLVIDGATYEIRVTDDSYKMTVKKKEITLNNFLTGNNSIYYAYYERYLSFSNSSHNYYYFFSKSNTERSDYDASYNCFDEALGPSSISVSPPKNSGYTFKGYYSSNNKSGRQYINQNGYLTSTLTSDYGMMVGETTNKFFVRKNIVYRQSLNMTITEYYPNESSFNKAASKYAATKWYARWQYTIAFNSNGGSGSMNSVTGYYGWNSIQLAANTFTRDGYEFVGWSTDPNASFELAESSSNMINTVSTTLAFDTTKMLIADQAYVQKNLNSSSTTMTLYAVWKPLTLTVTYDANGGSYSSKEVSGAQVVYFDEVSDSEGYDKYYPNPKVKDAMTAFSPSTGYDDVCSSYGVYAESAEFVLGEEGWTTDVYKPYYIYRDGYTFTGKWYTDSACTQEYVFGDSNVEDNFTLYAGWEKNKYDVTVTDLETGTAVPDWAAERASGYSGASERTDRVIAKLDESSLFDEDVSFSLGSGDESGQSATDSAKKEGVVYDEAFQISNPTTFGYEFAGWTLEGNEVEGNTSRTTGFARIGNAFDELSTWDGGRNAGTYFMNLTPDFSSSTGAQEVNGSVTLTGSWNLNQWVLQAQTTEADDDGTETEEATAVTIDGKTNLDSLNQTVVYTGEAQSPEEIYVTEPIEGYSVYYIDGRAVSESGTGSASASVPLKTDSKWDSSVPSYTKAGTYTVYFKLQSDRYNADGSPAQSDGTEDSEDSGYANYYTYIGSFTYTIEKPTSTLTLDKNKQTIKYSAKSGTNKESSTSGSFTYTFVGDGALTVSYSDSDGKSVTRNVTFPTSDDSSAGRATTDNNTAQTITITDGDGDNAETVLKITVAKESNGGIDGCTRTAKVTVTPYDTGTYTVNVKAVAAGNGLYKLPDGESSLEESYTLTVTGDTLSVDVTGYTGTYDGKWHAADDGTFTVKGSDGNKLSEDDYEVTYTYDAGYKTKLSDGTETAATTAQETPSEDMPEYKYVKTGDGSTGSYTVNYTVTASGYDACTGSFEATISKATPKVTIGTATAAEGAVAAYTVSSTNDDKTTDESGTGTDACEIKPDSSWTAAEDGTYTKSGSKGTFTLTRAEDGSWSVSYAATGTTETEVSSDSVTLTFESSETDNYLKGSASVTVTSTGVSWEAPEGQENVYKGDSYDPGRVTVSSKSSDGSSEGEPSVTVLYRYTYKDNSEGESTTPKTGYEKWTDEARTDFVNAGTYTIYYQVKQGNTVLGMSSDSTEGDSYTGSWKYTITKAERNLTVSEDPIVIYTGKITDDNSYSITGTLDIDTNESTHISGGTDEEGTTYAGVLSSVVSKDGTVSQQGLTAGNAASDQTSPSTSTNKYANYKYKIPLTPVKVGEGDAAAYVPGTYTVTVKAAGGNNYNEATKEVTVKLVAGTITATSEDAEYKYNGPQDAGTLKGVKATTGDESDAVDLKSYTITYTMKSGEGLWNDGITAKYSVSTDDSGNITYTYVSGGTYTSGNETTYGIRINGCSSGSTVSSLQDTVPEYTNVGTYTTEYLIEADGYESYTGTIKTTITYKAYVAVPTAKTGLVYETEKDSSGNVVGGLVQIGIDYQDGADGVTGAGWINDGDSKKQYSSYNDETDDKPASSGVNYGDAYKVQYGTSVTKSDGTVGSETTTEVIYTVYNGASANVNVASDTVTPEDYTAYAVLAPGYIWEDGTTEVKKITWNLSKASTNVTFYEYSSDDDGNKTGTLTTKITTDAESHKTFQIRTTNTDNSGDGGTGAGMNFSDNEFGFALSNEKDDVVVIQKKRGAENTETSEISPVTGEYLTCNDDDKTWSMDGAYIDVVDSGTSRLKVTSAETQNYKKSTGTLTLVATNLRLAVKKADGETTYDGTQQLPEVITKTDDEGTETEVGNSLITSVVNAHKDTISKYADATITYSVNYTPFVTTSDSGTRAWNNLDKNWMTTTESGTDGTGKVPEDLFVNAGTYTISYKIETNGYQNATGSVKYIINQETPALWLGGYTCDEGSVVSAGDAEAIDNVSTDSGIDTSVVKASKKDQSFDNAGEVTVSEVYPMTRSTDSDGNPIEGDATVLLTYFNVLSNNTDINLDAKTADSTDEALKDVQLTTAESTGGKSGVWADVYIMKAGSLTTTTTDESGVETETRVTLSDKWTVTEQTAGVAWTVQIASKGVSGEDVTVTVSTPETVNFKASSATYILKLTKGSVDVSQVGDTSYVYDGAEHESTTESVEVGIYSTDLDEYNVYYSSNDFSSEISSELLELDGDSVYEDNKDSWSTEPPTYTDAGEYTTYYIVVSNNYKTVGSFWKTTVLPKSLKGTDKSDDVNALINANLTDEEKEQRAVGPVSIGDKSDTITVDAIDNHIWTGLEQEPKVVVKDSESEETLVEDTDYTLTYSENIELGIATVTIKGIGNYDEEISTTFTIVQAPITRCDIDAVDDEIWIGSEITPSVTITDPINGNTLEEDVDYTLEYSENIELGTATITIKGIGNYCEETSTTFSIVQAPVGRCEIDALDDEIWTGSGITPSVTVTDPINGNILEEGKDYTLEYSENTKLGTATITIKGIGNYCEETSTTFSIVQAPISRCEVDAVDDEIWTGSGITPSVTVTDPINGRTLKEGTDYTLTYSKNIELGTATITIKGIGNYCEETTTTFSIVQAPITRCEVGAVNDEIWTGSGITPGVTMTDPKNGRTLKEGVDYTLEYIDNADEGTATIVITGIGNYTGATEVTFVIRRNSFGVSFDAAGGAFSDGTTVVSVSVKDRNSVVFPDAPERKGYTFLGWAPSGDKGTLYQPGQSYSVTEGLTFEAVWEKDETAVSKTSREKNGQVDTEGMEALEEIAEPIPVEVQVVDENGDGVDDGALVEDEGDTSDAGYTGGALVDEPESGTWALMNLLFASLSLVLGGVVIFRRRRKGDVRAAEDGSRGFRGMGIILVALSAAFMVIFWITEDVTLPMAMTDRWTPLMAAGALISTATAVMYLTRLWDKVYNRFFNR